MLESKANLYVTMIITTFLIFFWGGLLLLPRLSSPSISKIGIFLFIFIIAFLIASFNIKIKLLLLKMWVLIIASYNLLIGILSEPGATSSEVILLVGLKDMFVVVFLVVLFLGLLVRPGVMKDRNGIVKVTLLYFAIVLANIPISFLRGIPAMAILIGSRNLIIFPSVFIVGFFLGKYVREKDISSFTKFISFVSLGMIIFGLMEFFFLKKEVFWYETVNVIEYMRDRGAMTNLWMPGLSGFSRRMYGSLISPSQFGAFIATALPLMLITTKKKSCKTLLIFVTILISLFTFSKVAFVILAVELFAYALLSKRIMLAISSLLFFGILSWIIISGYIFVHIAHFQSVRIHLKGAIGGFEPALFSPFGSGVGAGGTLAAQYGGVRAGLESGVGTIGTNLGIIGLILYFLFFYKVLKILANIRRNNIAFRNLSIALFCSIGGLFIAQLFNENLLSTNNVGPFLMLAGILIGFYRNKIYRKKVR